MSSLTQDMTKKNPMGLILKFAVPLALGNIFQQTYTIIDSIIVGRGVGSYALASIGAVDWLQWMFVASLTGLTQGFGVAYSRSFGKKNYVELRADIGLSFILAVFIGLILTIFAQVFALPFLKILQTPQEIIYLSLEYVRYLFIGLIVVTLYNFFASILRAVGNSKAPLVAMIIAAVINIGLDLYFIYVLKIGVKGAAIATVIAQCFSALYCFMVLRKIDFIKPDKADFKFDWERSIALLKLGLPMSLMNIFIGIGGIIVQRVTNVFGIVFVTGVTITNKLYTLFEIGGTSIGLSVATYTAQNHGARLNKRIVMGIKSSVILGLIASFIIGGGMILFGRNIIGLFVDVNAENINGIIDVAYAYLKTMCYGVWMLYLLHIFRAALQGLGNTLFPLFSSMAEFCLRVGAVLTLPPVVGGYAVYYSEISAWIGAVILLGAGLYSSLKRLDIC